MTFRIPPGGFAGFAQMTPASRIALRGAMPSSGNGARRTRRRKTTKAKRAKRRTNGGRKLKFGSPAWRKKYMRKRKAKR